MTEFVQFLVLAFTALVWWLARRDLTANASRLRAASSAEVDRLRETVEALTAALEERVTTEEKRLSALIVEARSLQAPLVPRSVETVAASVPPQAAPAAVLSEAEPASAAPRVANRIGQAARAADGIGQAVRFGVERCADAAGGSHDRRGKRWGREIRRKHPGAFGGRIHRRACAFGARV